VNNDDLVSVKIMGERHCSTNPITLILRNNYSNIRLLPGTLGETRFSPELKSEFEKLKSNIPEKWDSRLIDIADQLCNILNYDRNLGWKHSLLPKSFIKDLKNEDVVPIFCVKNPYSWVVSMVRRPHEWVVRKPTDATDFLTSSWVTRVDEGMPRTLKSPLELWNFKFRRYIEVHDALISSGLNSFIVRSEDLILDPAQLIKSISGKAGLIQLNDTLNLDIGDTKDPSRGIEKLREYTKGRYWMEKLSPDEISLISSNVDIEIAQRLNYEIVT
jgi:hypothetical protein